MFADINHTPLYNFHPTSTHFPVIERTKNIFALREIVERQIKGERDLNAQRLNGNVYPS